MRVKNGRDLPITEITPENYVVPQGEEHLYHVLQEIKQFDKNTGKRLSIPCVQMYGKKGFEATIKHNLKEQGYTIDILHDPNEWLNEISKNKITLAKKAAQEAAEKAASEKAAEKAALKAEILAELKIDGSITSIESITGIETPTKSKSKE